MTIDYRRLVEACQVRPGSRVRLRDFDPADTCVPEFRSLGNSSLKLKAADVLEENRAALAAAQDLLWANDDWAVLVVFQAMDAAGKDGTIKHVMSGLNPQGCEVHGFRQPSEIELDHTWLWRYASKVPQRGRIGIFNRSYYEEVLVVKVHPEVLARQHLPAGPRGPAFWEARCEDINCFERHLTRNGTVVVKFFLHLSKAEQRRRLLARLDDRTKLWKFSMDDVFDRAYWDDYMAAYQQMLRSTSTEWAPWWVIPADHKYVARALVAKILTAKIRDLKLKYPRLTPTELRQLAKARREHARGKGARGR